MSWSISSKPVLKENFDKSLDDLQYASGSALLDEIPECQEARSQFEVAKKAAKLIAIGMPGPYVFAQFYGHANAIGYQTKPGFADNTITVIVSQVTKFQ